MNTIEKKKLCAAVILFVSAVFFVFGWVAHVALYEVTYKFQCMSGLFPLNQGNSALLMQFFGAYGMIFAFIIQFGHLVTHD